MTLVPGDTRKASILAGDVFEDTGPIVGAQQMNVTVYVSSAGPGTISLQHRDAANLATIDEVFIDVQAGDPKRLPFSFTLADGERLRLVAASAFSSPVQAAFVT